MKVYAAVEKKRYSVLPLKFIVEMTALFFLALLRDT